MLSVFAKIGNWAGGLLTPASQFATPSPVAPDIRAGARKVSGTLYSGPLAANKVIYTPWVDTTQTGGVFIIVSYTSTLALAANAALIQETDDPSNPLMLNNVTLNNTSVTNGVNSMGGVIRNRYWRTSFTMGSNASPLFVATYVEFNFVPPLQAYSGGQLLTGIPVLTAGNAGGLGTDGGQTCGGFVSAASSGIGANSIGTYQYLATQGANGAGTGMVVQRTPSIYRGAQFSAAGQNIIWTPRTGLKFRLMRYKIEVGEDATISGGPSPVNIAFTSVVPSQNTTALIDSVNAPGYTHRLVVPAAVLATSGNLYDSQWIDLGNGFLSPGANFPLAVGLMVPQSTSAVNPTWTVLSTQWEAATVGFKTVGALGNFKLIQGTSNYSNSNVASLAFSAYDSTPGNAIFVFIRYSKVVGGAATITVTDTASNTYTVTTQVANASDTANGSAICMAYCLNAVGNAANIVTVTFGTNNAANCSIQLHEYAGLGAVGIDAAQVGATGNSTSPASGNYTPATAGDLIFSYFGTQQGLTPAPTVDSNFRNIGFLASAVSSGTLCVADNFGNGALTAGQINVIACGTEE